MEYYIAMKNKTGSLSYMATCQRHPVKQRKSDRT